ncbi:MAG: Fic family protein [Sulfurovum sp.]|nr:Fic family protein [Sulfurovaceae bacterium]
MKQLSNIDKKNLQDRLKVEWTYTSNAIEGNTISLGDTAFIIENGLTVKGKSIAEHTEVVGHAKAIDLIYDLLSKDTMEENDIFSLHKAVQSTLVIDSECPLGAYKVVQNARYVKINEKLEHRYYPHPNDMQYLMKLWFQEFDNISQKQSFDELLTIYTNMHISFTSIHPFFDGNGRLARLVSNLPLLKNDFLPLIINNEDRQEYIELLANYNITAQELDSKSDKLVEYNSAYYKLYDFFKLQYKNSQNLLDEILRSK